MTMFQVFVFSLEKSLTLIWQHSENDDGLHRNCWEPQHFYDGPRVAILEITNCCYCLSTHTCEEQLFTTECAVAAFPPFTRKWVPCISENVIFSHLHSYGTCVFSKNSSSGAFFKRNCFPSYILLLEFWLYVGCRAPQSFVCWQVTSQKTVWNHPVWHDFEWIKYNILISLKYLLFFEMFLIGNIAK